MNNPSSRFHFRKAYEDRHEPEAQRLLALVYWQALLILMAISIVVSIAYGVWQFQKALPAEGESSVKSPQLLNKADLDTLLRALDERVEKFEAIRVAPATLKDPS